jgi:hypothetical protein
MIAAEKIAKVGKNQEDITAATTNKTAAENVLNDFLAVAGNSAMNKILVDIAAQNEKLEAAEKALKVAHLSCMPLILEEYINEQIAAKKTEMDYDNKTADEKAKLDEMFEKMLAKKTE